MLNKNAFFRLGMQYMLYKNISSLKTICNSTTETRLPHPTFAQKVMYIDVINNKIYHRGHLDYFK